MCVAAASCLREYLDVVIHKHDGVVCAASTMEVDKVIGIVERQLLQGEISQAHVRQNICTDDLRCQSVSSASQAAGMRAPVSTRTYQFLESNSNCINLVQQLFETLEVSGQNYRSTYPW